MYIAHLSKNTNWNPFFCAASAESPIDILKDNLAKSGRLQLSPWLVVWPRGILTPQQIVKHLVPRQILTQASTLMTSHVSCSRTLRMQVENIDLLKLPAITRKAERICILYILFMYYYGIQMVESNMSIFWL